MSLETTFDEIMGVDAPQEAQQSTALSESYKKAYSVHMEIKQNGELASSALVNMCKALKQMRDEKLYKELGYDTFDNYVENNGDYSFKARQAYTYISTYENLDSKLLQSNAGAGITKLALLTDIPAYERADFVAEHDLESESVAQLKAELEKYKPRAEQCSMFEIAKDEAESKASEAEKQLQNALELADKYKTIINDLRADCNESDKIINKLKSRPVEVAVAEPSEEDIKKIKAQAKEELEKELREEYFEKTNAAVKRANEAEQKMKAEQEQKAELEKKLKLGSADESLVAFKLYFNNIQDNFKKFIEVVESIEDPEKKAKFKGAVVNYLNLLRDGLKDEEPEEDGDDDEQEETEE